MFRRPFAGPLRRRIAGNVPPALQHANQLMAAGHYAQAAEIFEQFARGALDRNGPRAPLFFLQAGRARILSGQVAKGVEHLQQGLSLFAARGEWGRLDQNGRRIVNEFSARGLKTEAAQVEAYLKTTLPGGFVAGPGAGAEKPKSLLPTNCPGCGGPIRSDEVEWADEVTAECPYCGSAVRAEQGS